MCAPCIATYLETQKQVREERRAETKTQEATRQYLPSPPSSPSEQSDSDDSSWKPRQVHHPRYNIRQQQQQRQQQRQ